MTDLDLTEAIEVISRWIASTFPNLSEQAWEDASDDLTDRLAPVIERQVRERIAAEQEADDVYDTACRAHFARIARGGGS